jgi:hypothetical protein
VQPHASDLAGAVGVGYSVKLPPVVIRPILLVAYSVNHKAPSEPAAMWCGPLFAVGVGYSVKLPPVVIRPILLVTYSVNHKGTV